MMFGYASIRCTCHVTWHPFYSRLFRFDLQLEIVMKIIRQTMRTMDDVLIIMISVYSMIISCRAISTQKKCKRIARKNKLLIIKYLHNIIFTIGKKRGIDICNSNSLVHPLIDNSFAQKSVDNLSWGNFYISHFTIIL